MGIPFPVLESYLGFMRDVPRHQLPGGMVWDMLDWIPELDGSARKRFGWHPASASLFPNVHGTATSGIMCAYAPFSTGDEIVAVDAQGNLFRVVPGSGAMTYVGAAPTWAARPVYHRNKLIFMQPTNDIIEYSGGGGVLLGNSTPHAHCGTLWGDYTALGNTYEQNANPQRIYFSAAGDPTTYDMTNSWQDVPGPIIGLQGVRGLLVAFTAGQMWRIRGNTPPQAGVVGNLVREHLYDTGLLDERSIATYGETVIFANAEGVWETDGAKVTNLTSLGGIATYWQAIMLNYSSSTWRLVGGVYKGYYVISISNGSTFEDCLVCDLGTKRWFRWSNINAGMFAHGLGSTEALYFVQNDATYVGDVAGCFLNLNGSDPGNAIIYPSIETPFFRGWQHFHRKWIPSDSTSVWQRAYLNYDAGGAGSALRLAYTLSPELGAAYTTSGDLAVTTAPVRARMPINPDGGGIPSRWIGFKIYQAAGMNPTDLRVNDFELEYYTREGSR